MLKSLFILSLTALVAGSGMNSTMGAPHAQAPALAVDLGMAGMFAVLAKSGVSTVPNSSIRGGHVGVSPAAASYITGFALTLDSSGKFATSTQVQQKVLAADYALPTPGMLTQSVLDMEAAFTDAAGRLPDFLEVGAGDIGGMNLGPGVYKWTSGVLIPTDLTLTGSAADVFIFQIDKDLVVGSAVSVFLAGGVRPRNVFWQVTGLVDIGTTARFHGNVLCATGITLKTDAMVCGRLLAQTAVILDANVVRAPNHH